MLSLSKLERFMHAFSSLWRVRLGLYVQANQTLKYYKNKKAQPYTVRLIGKKASLSVAQLCHDIERASKLVPQATCLVKALAGKALLAEQGYSTDLKLGVKKDQDLKAHAWLEHGGQIILGDITNLADYSVLKGGAM